MTRGSGGVRSWARECRYCGVWYRISNLQRREGCEDAHTIACQRRTPEERERYKAKMEQRMYR